MDTFGVYAHELTNTGSRVSSDLTNYQAQKNRWRYKRQYHKRKAPQNLSILRCFLVDRSTNYANTLRKKIRVILISANDALTQLFRRISCC